MAIKINFDVVHNPEVPTIILAKKNGYKIGQLNAKAIEVSDSLNDASEITFVVNKYIDGKKCEYWEQIVNFKLVYCVEWDMWFEITVELDQATETKKTVYCTQLGHAELSQIMLYTIEINTENDIAREDYKTPTILYNPWDTSASLLHRIMEKAQHYTVIHVDETIANIQRTFTFDSVSIYDAFQEIAEEIHCLFVLHSNSDENGNIQRTISVYDLESNCKDCGHRGEFTRVCPKCGGTDINEGYGNDTTIFISSDEIAEDIQLTSDTKAIKNCFKLEGGDDLMTATIRNCNPNGSEYIWYISDALKEDMSSELVSKITEYDKLFNNYQKSYTVGLSETLLLQYNSLVTKYLPYNSDLEKIVIPIVGYSSLMNAYYNTIDLSQFLQHTLMPSAEMIETTAAEEAAKLTTVNLSPVSIDSIATLSVATADNAVLAMANVIIDSRYRVKVASSELERKETYQLWTGSFTVTNYANADDTATSSIISIIVNDDYSAFVQQRLQKSLREDDTDDLSISGLFAKEDDAFVSELKKYSLSCLKSFYNSCQTCIDILIEQGTGNKSTWDGNDPNLYEDLYLPYLDKMAAIEAEIQIRQSEVDSIIGVYDAYGDLKIYGVQNYLEEAKLEIQEALDFHGYLGDDLWLEFCAFRREDKFSNNNYISDGLNNAELFKRAYEFIEIAQKEIYKSAELQHSIATSLKNLLTIEKFKPLVNDFEVGNWLRIMVDDELYKLRLIHYSIDYDDLNNISVEFSDVVKANSTVKSVQEVLEQATAMATSYSSIQRQAKQGEESRKFLSNWSSKGLDITATKIMNGATNQTQTWDEHGMLFKKYDKVAETFEDIQLKIINSTIAITDDNWKTVKTAVGAYYYFHPETGKLIRAYGVNAETLVGQLIIGEQLGIYNESGSLSFDNNGLIVASKHNQNSFRVNPNSEILVAINNGTQDVFYIDSAGNLHISGDGTNINIEQNTDVTGMRSQITLNKEAIANETKRAVAAESDLSDSILELGREIDSINNGASNNVNKSEFGGLIVENYSSVHTAWNNISKYIQLKDNEIRIYKDTTLQDNSILMKLSNTGHHYYHNGSNVAKINITTNSSNYGLMFDLGYDADYIGWGYQETQNGDYTPQLIYYSNDNIKKKGLHLIATTYCESDLYINNDIHTFTDDNGNGGLHSDSKSIVIQGSTTKLKSSGAEFECATDKFIFAKSTSGLMECNNNINLYRYDILNQADFTLQTNILDTEVDALNILNQISLKKFDWIDGGIHEDIGIVAQNIKSVLPNIVYTDSSGIMSIKMNRFIPYLIKAVQELYVLATNEPEVQTDGEIEAT